MRAYGTNAMMHTHAVYMTLNALPKEYISSEGRSMSCMHSKVDIQPRLWWYREDIEVAHMHVAVPDRHCRYQFKPRIVEIIETCVFLSFRTQE
jgi:hypothetical protein